MEIKLIAMDMDGTLLRKDNTISPYTIKVLKQVQKKGVRLALASGRSYTRLLSYAKQLEMDRYGGYLIEINGVAIYDLKNKKRYVKGRIPAKKAQEIFAYFKQFNVEIIGNMDEGMYDYNPPCILEEKKRYIIDHHMDKNHPLTGGAFNFLANAKKGYPDLRYIQEKEEIVDDVNKISVTYWPEEMAKVAQQAKHDLGDEYWVGLTTNKWLEVLMPGVTKAYGLEKLSAYTKIPVAAMMAIGDGENDIEMLTYAGVGVAMENALDSVKEIADEITCSNMEDGVAKAILRYLSI